MADAEQAHTEFRLRDFALSVYLPTILFSIGQGTVIPIIPLFAKDLGASVVVASLMVACRGFGQLAFDLPAGIAVSRWGDKWAMVAGALLVSVVAVGAAFRPSIMILAGLITLMGGGWSFWLIARLAFVAEQAPMAQRGRALAMVGGLSRVGNFIGPGIGGVLASVFGLEAAFITQAVLGIAAAAVMFLVVRDSVVPSDIGTHGTVLRLFETARSERKPLLLAGPPVYAISALRQARQVFLPLWGDSIGLGVAQIGFIAGLSFFIDAAVFYPSGIIMDQIGRKWAAVPSLIALSIGVLLLPATSEIYSFTGAAIIMGAGNGLGAGIVQTLGTDYAPADRRGEFLGLWRLMSDTGQVGGPLMISGLAGFASLGIAAFVSGGVGLLGAIMIARFVRETLPSWATVGATNNVADLPP